MERKKKKWAEEPRGVTVPRQRRSLRIVKRVKNAPVLGICEYCNMQFSADPLGQPAEAQATMQQQFNAHKCRPEDASQAAARIVREATEGK